MIMFHSGDMRAFLADALILICCGLLGAFLLGAVLGKMLIQPAKEIEVRKPLSAPNVDMLHANMHGPLKRPRARHKGRSTRR